MESTPYDEASDDNHAFGLEVLFTNTDYRTVSISIPVTDGPHCNDLSANAECEPIMKELTVNLSCSMAASTDYDLTGQIIWPVSVLVGHYLASRRGQELVREKNVVELGAGCGLPGLTAAHFANRVALTDGNDTVIDLLKQNCSLLQKHGNLDDGNDENKFVLAMKLLWGNRKQLNHLLKVMSRVDVVVAADVVQWPAVIDPLIHTIKALLWNSASNGPTCILGLVDRASSTSRLFFDTAARHGFVCRKVEYHEFLKNGNVPETCKERGGCETNLYELVLSNRSKSPALFDQLRENEDLVVGKNFKNTFSMPC